jgi:hypothetical protein
VRGTSSRQSSLTSRVRAQSSVGRPLRRVPNRNGLPAKRTLGVVIVGRPESAISVQTLGPGDPVITDAFVRRFNPLARSRRQRGRLLGKRCCPPRPGRPTWSSRDHMSGSHKERKRGVKSVDEARGPPRLDNAGGASKRRGGRSLATRAAFTSATLAARGPRLCAPCGCIGKGVWRCACGRSGARPAPRAVAQARADHEAHTRQELSSADGCPARGVVTGRTAAVSAQQPHTASAATTVPPRPDPDACAATAQRCCARPAAGGAWSALAYALLSCGAPASSAGHP